MFYFQTIFLLGFEDQKLIDIYFSGERVENIDV